VILQLQKQYSRNGLPFSPEGAILVRPVYVIHNKNIKKDGLDFGTQSLTGTKT